MLKTARAVTASIVRLAVYVKTLTLITGGVEVDTKRMHLYSTWLYLANLSTPSLTTGLYWSLLESGLALIAACLPTLTGQFFRKTSMSGML
jgi:hypothetical protein